MGNLTFEIINTLIIAGAGVAGAAVGGWVTYRVAFDLHSRKQLEERQALGHALASEIEAYVALMERRGWANVAEQMIFALNAIPAAQQQPMLVQHLVVANFKMTRKDIEQPPNPISQALIGDVGKVGPVSGDLVRFWSMVNGVRATIIGAYESVYFQPLLPGAIAGMLQRELDMWREAKSLSESLVRNLRNLH